MPNKVGGVALNLVDFAKESAVKERIDFIYNSLKREFPLVRYDERDTIIGIGEEGKYLLCYFKLGNEGEKQVKFKSLKTPLLLMGEIADIENAIKETIAMFCNSDMTIRPRDKTTPKTNSERTKDFVIDEGSVEHAEFANLMASIQPSYDETEIESIASRRLFNALSSAGIIYVGDLRKWTYYELRQIPWFGKKSYEELCSLLLSLSNDVLPEELSKRNIGFLNIKATQKTINKWENTSEAKAYLLSINDDETQFAEGTLGKVLCLRRKARQYKGFTLDKTVDEIKAQYLSNQKYFAEVAIRVEELITETLKWVSEPERNFPMLCSYIGLNCDPLPLREVGAKYGVTGERVNQIFKKTLLKMAHTFSLKKEEGLYRFIQKGRLLKEINEYGIEAFFVFLTLKEKKQYVKAAKRILLYQVIIPEDFNDKIDSICRELKHQPQKTNKEETVKKGRLNYEGFELLLDDDGEVLTDVELLMKLKEKRLAIATEMKVPAYMVYNNKQLVSLATFKPVSKEMYVALSGFTANTWERFGFVMIDVIKKHK